ncbi:tRNA (adenosine(37)-N6)-threonylcarbamoyltransferase complex transferase subunit TsaD, partial [Candidatus Peregrinibacteria bacterium]|nr:tRNA (adenosine(37)-N6)-threonylcarbamoyltransferase complex transferase subunit TsaD [Candidatus Peregrinibacteria bacterium]
VVKNGTQILSNVIASQIKLHAKTGGVVPEVAAREHVVKITPVIAEVLKKARVGLKDIDAIAVTAGPGLLSSLLIGVNAAMTLALVHKKPLIPVNHIEGHIYANWLGSGATPQFPIVVLTVSGGHNELIFWKNHGEYKFLGSTLDDAGGEAFDKVARLLGLPYPGGPEIQKIAQHGDPNKYKFPRAWVTNFDFSFSGLKTSVLYLMKKLQATSYKLQADIAASFQEAVCEVLATKLVNAAIKFKAKEAHLAGGVSANTRLREWTKKLLPPEIRLRFCENISLCTDNATMIAAAGYFKFKKNPAKYKKWRPIIADPNFDLISVR